MSRSIIISELNYPEQMNPLAQVQSVYKLSYVLDSGLENMSLYLNY